VTPGDWPAAASACGGARTSGQAVRDTGPAGRIDPLEFIGQAVDRSLDAVVVLGPELEVRYWNRVMEFVSGFAADEAMGRPIAELFPELRAGEDLRLLSVLGGAYAACPGDFFGCAVATRRGEFDSYYGPLWADGAVRGVVVIGRHRVPGPEEKLLESERRFRTMANCAPVLLWMSGCDALCDFFNQTWLDFTGRTLAQEVGVGWAEGVHPEDFALCMDTYMQAFTARRPFSMEYRLRRCDGAYRWMLDCGAPRHDAAGRFAGFIGSCVDITERKQAEDSERQAGVLLRLATAQMEQFLFAASHDLKEPLRMVASYTALLARRYGAQLDERAHRYIRYAAEGASRMSSLIDGILEFASVSRQRVAPRQVVDVSALLAEVVADLEDSIAASRARLCWSDLPPVWGSQPLVKLVLHNLVGNALKFRGARAPEVEVRADPLGGMWRFEVRDNGIGFEPRFSEEIFAMFRRLQPRSDVSGNGVGLAICREIVGLHDGQIWAEGRPGQGASIFFTLPAAESGR
jgi:PAS domain S-box-containing protein